MCWCVSYWRNTKGPFFVCEKGHKTAFILQRSKRMFLFLSGDLLLEFVKSQRTWCPCYVIECLFRTQLSKVDFLVKEMTPKMGGKPRFNLLQGHLHVTGLEEPLPVWVMDGKSWTGRSQNLNTLANFPILEVGHPTTLSSEGHSQKPGTIHGKSPWIEVLDCKEGNRDLTL